MIDKSCFNFPASEKAERILYMWTIEVICKAPSGCSISGGYYFNWGWVGGETERHREREGNREREEKRESTPFAGSGSHILEKDE